MKRTHKKTAVKRNARGRKTKQKMDVNMDPQITALKGW